MFMPGFEFYEIKTNFFFFVFIFQKENVLLIKDINICIDDVLYIFIIFFASTNSFAKPEYIKEGIDLYNKNKFEDAKFKFEQDIVFNPKSELSYLYLSKIFKKQDKKSLEEKNLDTVILLNPNIIIGYLIL